MGCCHEPPHLHHRSVLPERYVLPIRIVVLASLAASSLYILTHLRGMSPLLLAGLFFHLLVATRALNECRRSVHFHRLQKEFDRKIASLE